MTDVAAGCVTLEIERKGDEALVRLHGRLVASVSGNFYARICPLLSECKRVVLDLADVPSMDSIGLGALVRLMVSAKSRGCRLELLHLGKRVRELLGLTNLLGCFTVLGEKGVVPRF